MNASAFVLACISFAACAAFAAEPAKSVLDFNLDSIEGKPYPLAQNKGKVMLIVNVASKCGNTPQYKPLEELHEKYAKDGLAILALKTGAPILPVGISGTDRFWPRGSRPHPGGRIAMRVGDAFTLPPDITQNPDRRAAKTAATRLVMGRIAELLPSRHRGAYGRPMG